MNIRFYPIPDSEFLVVKLKEKATGQWKAVGTCHSASKPILKKGERVFELINFYTR